MENCGPFLMQLDTWGGRGENDGEIPDFHHRSEGFE
jgi:hypothetical protein